jgi:histidinol-phosphate aminotransferase
VAPVPLARLLDPLLPPYEPDLTAAQLARRLGVARIAKLDANECQFGPSPRALEAAQAAVAHANRYPESGGVLLERICARHDVEPERVAIGHGADALIGHLATAMLTAGDEAVIPAPSFVTYRQDVARVGATAVEVPVHPDGVLDLEALGASVGDRTRLVFVCNPNNPTGGLAPRGAVEALVAALPPSVLVVLDEAYAEYVEPELYQDGPALVRAYPNVAILRTFSKLFGLAGLRVGYLVGPPAVADAVRRLRHWYDVTDAGHLAAAASIDDLQELARRRAATDATRSQWAAALRAVGLQPLPSATNFLTSPVPQAAELADRLAARGVLVRAVGGPLGELLRVSLGNDDDLEQLVAALKLER